MKDKRYVSKLTRIIGIPIRIMLAIICFFEVYKITTRLDYIFSINVIPIIINALIVLAILLILVLNILGNRKIPVFWFVIFALNLLTIFLSLRYTGAESVEVVFGMPAVMFYLYFGAQILLSILVGFYGWSLTLPSEGQSMEALKKGKDFGDFINTIHNEAKK